MKIISRQKLFKKKGKRFPPGGFLNFKNIPKISIHRNCVFFLKPPKLVDRLKFAAKNRSDTPAFLNIYFCTLNLHFLRK